MNINEFKLTSESLINTVISLQGLIAQAKHDGNYTYFDKYETVEQFFDHIVLVDYNMSLRYNLRRQLEKGIDSIKSSGLPKDVLIPSGEYFIMIFWDGRVGESQVCLIPKQDDLSIYSRDKVQRKYALDRNGDDFSDCTGLTDGEAMSL